MSSLKRRVKTPPTSVDYLRRLKHGLETQAGIHIESLTLRGGVWHACMTNGSCVPVRRLLDSCRLSLEH